MSDTLLMIHGGFAGGWCFEEFRKPFEAAGWHVLAPDLPGHGKDRSELVAGTGLHDYETFLRKLIDRMDAPPVLVGHSMGGLLAQMLASRDCARAAILLAPAAPWGILPTGESEIAAARGLMAAGDFWTRVLEPAFEVAAADSLNCLPEDRQREVFDRFGRESGQALFEMLFWMFDPHSASHIRTVDVACPLLCVAGGRDRLVTSQTVRQIAAKYGEVATTVEFDEMGHMLLLESGWSEVADVCLEWLAGLPKAGAG